MNRRGTVALLALATVGVAGVTPALASSAGKPKPLKGTWSFTDFTPDPTVSVLNTAESRTGSTCEGALPAGPTDVNAHTIKVKGKGTLTVDGNNTLDWAMEVRDAKGNQLAVSDGTLPQDKEGIAGLAITKPGTYSVVFCNLGGAPTATAAYSFKYR